MIDQAREWLERLHVSNAPEADMALDLLGRLDADADEQMEFDRERLERSLTGVCEALGADGPEEAIAMARTLREAFE